jgi:radical SAM superfamily enzyme YgiQ (UPF0313 family)
VKQQKKRAFPRAGCYSAADTDPMSGRILLISVNECDSPYPVFPLGLAHLDAALQAAGWQTEWLDCQYERAALPERLRSFRPDFVGLSLRNIDDVLIHKRETFFNGLAQLCQEIRRHVPCPIILGGSGFSIFPVPLLAASGADFGLQGEAEASLVALLNALQSKSDFANIPGLVFRRNGDIVANPTGDFLPLARLPEPVRPPGVADYYLKASAMLNVQTQRGCAFQCCYCTYPVIEGRGYRRRSPKEVADDLAQIKAAGARYFFVVDSVFNSSNEHVAAICEAIIQRNPGLRWGCFLRPSRLTPELAGLMARAGLAHVEFGTDSFCDSVLDAYGKQFTFAEVLRSSELARQAGIDFCHFLICGGPGETMATLEEGFQNSLQLPAGVVLPLIGMRIYPGTELHDMALRQGRLAPETDLLTPRYYLADGLAESAIAEQLRDFARRSPRWIVGEAPPAYTEMVERLRRNGVIGPLWSFYSWVQQFSALMPKGPP